MKLIRVRDGLGIRGPIQEIGQDHLDVLGLTFFVDGHTEIFNDYHEYISFDALFVGQIVQVKALVQQDGTFLATRIKIEDDDEDEVGFTGPLVFSCLHLHEVTEVTKGRRFALLSFFYHINMVDCRQNSHTVIVIDIQNDLNRKKEFDWRFLTKAAIRFRFSGNVQRLTTNTHGPRTGSAIRVDK